MERRCTRLQGKEPEDVDVDDKRAALEDQRKRMLSSPEHNDLKKCFHLKLSQRFHLEDPHLEPSRWKPFQLCWMQKLQPVTNVVEDLKSEVSHLR